MPGYPVLERDKQNLEAKFLCEYCQSVLRDATRASCGHFFCGSCVKYLFRDNPAGVIACSRTGTPLFLYQFSSDDNFCNKVLNLTVHCLFLDTGCRWTGKLHEFEDHVEKCAFGSCYGKKVGQSGACEKHSGLEVNSNVDRVNSDLTEQLDEKCLSQLVKCEYCNSQVNVDVMKFHQSQCPEFPVVLDKCGNDGIPQAKKEQLNVPQPLQRQLNFLLPNKNSPENSMEFKGERGPSLAAGNCETRITSSPSVFADFMEQYEKRLNYVENKVAQHDLVLRENYLLKQDVRHLTDAIRDVSNKVHHIQRTLECQKREHDTFQGNLNALQIEQINLQARFNRLLESPLPRAELARLNRSMEVIQERIVRLERHSRSHGGLLTNLANSVTALANQVRHATILGVDIQRV